MTAPQPRAKSPSKKQTSATARTWAMRAMIALVLGLGIGGAVGVVGVRRMDPGHPGQPDSLRAMLDSVRDRAASDPLTQRRAADSSDAAQRAGRYADSMALANDSTAPAVPNVVGMEEGAARFTIELLGLVVGSVQFKASPLPAGTVMASVPVAMRKVRLGTAIDLVLSDGRSPTDTTDTAAFLHALLRLP